MDNWKFEDFMNVVWYYFLQEDNPIVVARNLGLNSEDIMEFEDSILAITSEEQADLVFGDVLLETTYKMIKDGNSLQYIVEEYKRVFSLKEEWVKSAMMYDSFSEYE